MDDQNPQNQQGTGINPGAVNPVQDDAALPWMNFSPEGAGAPAAGAQTGAATSDDMFAPMSAPIADSIPAGSTFDPFGNPFATPAVTEDAAAAFAPSSQDGSLQSTSDNTFTGGFVPSEPSAFTPTFSETPVEPATPAAMAAPVENAVPSWMNETPATNDFSGSSIEEEETDTLDMLTNFKTSFEEEEEDFNKQIEEHNLNIQYEKEAISKLRAKRSERLTQMREIVRKLDDLLGTRKPAAHEQKEAESRGHGRNTRAEEPRRAEKMSPKKQERTRAADDFLAA